MTSTLTKMTSKKMTSIHWHNIYVTHIHTYTHTCTHTPTHTHTHTLVHTHTSLNIKKLLKDNQKQKANMKTRPRKPVDYNDAKILKQMTREIMLDRKRKRAQKKKDETRRRKMRERRKRNKVSSWSIPRRAEIARNIMSLGRRYVSVLWEFVKTYESEESLDGTINLFRLEDNTLYQLKKLTDTLMEEKNIPCTENLRILLAKKLSNIDEDLVDDILRVYRIHHRNRFNKMPNEDEIDISFPFPVQGLIEMEKLITRDKRKKYARKYRKAKSLM